MVVDWGLQRYRVIMSTNGRRVITGLLAGFGMGVIQIIILLMFFKWIQI